MTKPKKFLQRRCPVLPLSFLSLIAFRAAASVRIPVPASLGGSTHHRWHRQAGDRTRHPSDTKRPRRGSGKTRQGPGRSGDYRRQRKDDHPRTDQCARPCESRRSTRALPARRNYDGPEPGWGQGICAAGILREGCSRNAPRLYVAGPIQDSSAIPGAVAVTTPEQARKSVDELIRNKPDFVKVRVDDFRGARQK